MKSIPEETKRMTDALIRWRTKMASVFLPSLRYPSADADVWAGSSIAIYYSKHYNESILKPKINNQITAPELRIIDEKGENLGVLTREKALALARPEEGLDLIEISPNAKPPVARLMSYDKFRYEEEKREKKERLAQKSVGMKHVQITARAAQNDLMIKVHQVEKFFNEGHPVEINLRLRGREKRNQAWAMEKLQQFLKIIPVEYKKLTEAKFSGNGPGIQIAKK
jgi:translation initiation factor IF-3